MNNISLSSSALLVTLSLSAYSGNKLDRSVSDEIDHNKNTQTRAGKYTKSLFADEQTLKAIGQHDSATRQMHKQYTLPWSFDGVALLPMGNYMTYLNMMGQREKEREALVSAFLTNYSTIIGAQAFKLGDLFDKDDYPSETEVATRFKFNLQFSPLPESGDFRVDIGNEGLNELRSKYDSQLQSAVSVAMSDLSERFKTILTRMVTQLREVPEGEKRPRIYESLLGNARDLIELMPAMNIANDTQLEYARQQLLDVIDGVETEDLKDDDLMRRRVREVASDILDKWDF
jgi:hypothetical protein